MKEGGKKAGPSQTIALSLAVCFFFTATAAREKSEGKGEGGGRAEGIAGIKASVHVQKGGGKGGGGRRGGERQQRSELPSHQPGGHLYARWEGERRRGKKRKGERWGES